MTLNDLQRPWRATWPMLLFSGLAMSVYCPSVRLSVRNAPVSDENGLTYCHSFFTIRYPNHSSFIGIKHLHKIQTGAKYRWGTKISRFSTNKSLYLAHDTRQRHSYYIRRIGNRTQAFEWHQFQWPWVTSNPESTRYYSTSNNSKMVQDRAIFTMADQ